MKSTEKKLRNILKINAAFTIVSALVLTILSNSIANLMHIENNSVLQYIGIGLLLFAVSLIYNGTKRELSHSQIKFIVIQDCAWVAGSAALIILNPFNITPIGNIIIASVAVIVGLFGYFQYTQ